VNTVVGSAVLYRKFLLFFLPVSAKSCIFAALIAQELADRVEYGVFIS
jgi:hypothetical protein